MPLYRRLLAAAFCGLLSAAALGQGGSDPPYDLKRHPVAPEIRQGLEFLGHRFDLDKGLILAPDGRPLTVGGFEAYLKPYDFRKSPLKDEHRANLVYSGYRLDEGSGAVLSPETKQPSSRLDVEVFVRGIFLSEQNTILERIRHELSRHDPRKPLPPEALVRIQTLARVDPSALPEGLRRALERARRLPASALTREAEEAYADSTRFFDGQTTLKERLKSSLPVVPGWNEPRRASPQYFDDAERRLGEALTRDTAEHLAKNPVGKELLERFKGRDGRAGLPGFMVLKIDPKAGAVYNQSDRSVVINHQYILDGVLEGAPERDRERLGRELADPRKLAAYLMDHPEARKAFVGRVDETIVHELTHAAQDRRDRVLEESTRGNIPNAIHLEYEHEAFLTEMRYMHAKLMADPASLDGAVQLPLYESFLSDFDGWREGITRTYLASWPHYAATIPTARSVQKTRIGLARRMMGESLYQSLYQSLKLLGLARGSAALKEAESGLASRMERFTSQVYPRLRYDGWRKLAGLHESRGRADLAFFALQGAATSAAPFGEEEARQARERLRLGADRAVAWLAEPGRELSLDEWLRAVVGLETYYVQEGRPVPEALARLRVSVYRQGAQRYIALARAEQDRARRTQLLDVAEGYARAIGDAELLREIAELRKAGDGR